MKISIMAYIATSSSHGTKSLQSLRTNQASARFLSIGLQQNAVCSNYLVVAKEDHLHMKIADAAATAVAARQQLDEAESSIAITIKAT
jgi:hypothetical protein